MNQVLKILSFFLCITLIMGCFADISPSSQFTTSNSSSVSGAANLSKTILSPNLSNYRQTAHPLSPSNQTQPISKSPTLNRSYVPDRVLVQYKPDAISATGGVSQVSATLNANIQATVLADESTLGLQGIQLVKIPNATTVDAAIQYYANNSYVAYVQPDYIYQACDESDAIAVASVADNFSNYLSERRESGFASSNYSSPSLPSQIKGEALGNNTTSITSWPNDPYYSYQWDMLKMAAPSAWAVSTGSSSVTVAVVDTGVDYSHPDLAANCVSGYDFVNHDSDPMDDNGHGTHCAGSIAAIGNNGVGIAGVTWSSKIMPLKFLNSGGSGYTSDALSAFAWGYAKGVRIFSNSWGGYGTDTSLQSAINTYSDAIFICAAGNDGYNIDSYTFSPAGLSCANIISVAATSSSDALASWSNYGATTVDVAAPGVSIYSCKPGSSYQYMSGTSMATPHVAGLAALVKAVNSGYTMAQIKSAILSGVDTVSGLSGKCVTGGRVNTWKALGSPNRDCIGIFRNGVWHLNTAGATSWSSSIDKVVSWGLSGDIPIVGDFNKDGYNDNIGIFRNGVWHLNTAGATSWSSSIDKVVSWGLTGDIPIVGDFDKDGYIDNIGIFRNGVWHLNIAGATSWTASTDKVVSWGLPGDIPIVGDFDKDGYNDNIGIFRNGVWHLNTAGATSWSSSIDKVVSWGLSGDIPNIGDFSSDVYDDCIGIYRNGIWHLNTAGATSWSSSIDKVVSWGLTGDTSITGSFSA